MPWFLCTMQFRRVIYNAQTVSGSEKVSITSYIQQLTMSYSCFGTCCGPLLVSPLAKQFVEALNVPFGRLRERRTRWWHGTCTIHAIELSTYQEVRYGSCVSILPISVLVGWLRPMISSSWTWRWSGESQYKRIHSGKKYLHNVLELQIGHSSALG